MMPNQHIVRFQSIVLQPHQIQFVIDELPAIIVSVAGLMTQVVVVAEGGYIRHIVVLPPIEPRRVARTNHDTAAINGENNKSRIRQSVAYRKIGVITWLNGDYLNRNAEKL